MKRREWIIGGAAALAAAGIGAGVSLWRNAVRAEADGAAVWPLQFDRPAGEKLSMTEFRGQPLLLNFWATWCPPCVSELPLLDRFYRDGNAPRWRVLGLAVDSLEPVKAFLAQRPVRFPIGMAGLEGVDLSRTLGNEHGSLPFTVVFDSSGKSVDRKLGIIRPADLQRWQASVR